MRGKDFKKALNGCSFKNTNILCIKSLEASKSLIENITLGDEDDHEDEIQLRPVYMEVWNLR